MLAMMSDKILGLRNVMTKKEHQGISVIERKLFKPLNNKGASDRVAMF
jgi:hypothetical protein